MSENNKELTAAQMLYEARTVGRRKREIATISKLLCIREEYLVALEKGKYEQIPEVVYVLGFARNYAMELGLDPDEIVAKIKQEMGLVEECCPRDDSADEIVEAKPAVSVAKKNKSASNKNNFLSVASKYVYKHWKWLVAGIVALVIVILGIVVIVNLGGESNAAGDTEAVATVVKEPEYKTEVRERFGTENRANARIIIQAAQESWVKIEDARGNTVFSRVLVPGDVYYMPEGDKYKGTFGNAGGVDIWVDGNLAPKLGVSHTRKSGVLMTPEGLMPGAEVVVE